MTGKRHSLNKAVQSTGTWTTTAPSYEFDGTDDYIDLGADAPTDLTGDLTISAWINPSGWGEFGEGRIIDNGKLRFVIYSTNNRIRFESVAGVSIYSADNSISLNAYQHILVTRPSAGTNTNIYINGVLSGTPNQNSGTPTGGTTNTTIGSNAALNRTFDGQISGLKIWNELLDVSQINYLYSKEKGNY